jgi:hypothetical protein
MRNLYNTSLVQHFSCTTLLLYNTSLVQHLYNTSLVQHFSCTMFAVCTQCAAS